MGFSQRLQELLSAKGWKQQDLADLTHINKSTISRWICEGLTPGSGSLNKICSAFGCNYGWLKDGTGEMFPLRGLGNEQLTGQQIDIPGMIKMTIAVLESETVYRAALASNIRAFHQAVEKESEMEGLKEKLEKMQAQIDELQRSINGSNDGNQKKREAQA